MKCKWLILTAMNSTSDSIAIMQYHKSQWKQWWKKYRKCIADVHIILTQRFHLFNKMIKMWNDLQKVKSTFIIHIRIECIDLNIYLHFRNISDAESMWCNCNWNHQMMKHVLMHCLNWSHLQSRMLQNINFLNYWIIITIMRSFKAAARMMMKMKLLKQFKVTKSFFNVQSTQTNLIHSFIMIVSTAWSSCINSEWFSISKSFAHSI